MKKIIILLIVFFVIVSAAVILFRFINKNNNQNTSNLASPTPTAEIESNNVKSAEPTQSSQILDKDGTQVKWVILRDISRLKLYSNLEEKLTSYEAKDKYLCSSLTTASFYGTNGSHIGLFITDSNILSAAIDSSLFNGYFYIKNKIPYISSIEPINSQIAIQAGPLLIEKEKYLETSGDEGSRRIVLATNRQDQIIFLAIYDGTNPVSGPSLKELPGVLRNIDNNTSLDFLDAINLDGGTHSAFITDDVRLTEISTAGSYFCF